MLAPTRKEPLCRASLVQGECSDLEEVASAMRDYDFVARLLERLEMPGEGEPYPHDADPYPADPRDASFDCLGTLYFEADEAQRAQIAALFAREAEQSTQAHSRIASYWVAARERARDYLSNLIFYMRRLSTSMGSGDAASRLRLELWPRRRSCTSARRAGIDPDPHFREVAALAQPETEEFIRGFLERDEADIEQMVQAFS
jgi:hypothetical protein